MPPHCGRWASWRSIARTEAHCWLAVGNPEGRGHRPSSNQALHRTDAVAAGKHPGFQRRPGKPEVRGLRRMGVALALGKDVDEAKEKAIRTASLVRVAL